MSREMDLDDIRMLVNKLVDDELGKAILKHGLQRNVSIDRQYLIMLEEIGEIAKAIIEDDLDNAQIEITQSIAMLIKLYWRIYKTKGDE